MSTSSTVVSFPGAEERADIVSNSTAMPSNQDYITAYVKQAPGHVNLISPFTEMPSELLIPYAEYRGYGLPRLSKGARAPRMSGYHEPRVHSPAGSFISFYSVDWFMHFARLNRGSLEVLTRVVHWWRGMNKRLS